MNNDNHFSKKNPNASITYFSKLHSNEIQKNGSINRIQIFASSNSNSKNKLRFQLTRSSVSSNNNALPLRKSRVMNNYDFDSEEKILKELYKIQDDDNDIPKLSQKFLEVKDCSILKYGLKPSYQDIEFSFCRTCDPNLTNPICAECIKICHFGHKIKKKNKKGQIKCVCGERLHCMSKNPDLTINNTSCLLGEWFVISKLNFYYKTKDSNCLCMLCYNFCNSDKNKEIVKTINIDKNKISHIPNCCCNNEEVHQEKKFVFEKLEEIARDLENFDYFNLLHPSQIINMIFLSKKQFEFNYTDLIEFNNFILSDNLMEYEFNSFKKTDFSSTNCYMIFTNLISFIKWNKYTNISYYCKEAENYFSFKRLKPILSLLNKMENNDKSFWSISSKFLELFHKIYLGNLTQSFSKFKLYDLENFSSSLRWICCNSNENNFREGQDIIIFLLEILNNINLKGFSCLEAMDTIIIIIKIFKKTVTYNLISNGNMVKIIQEIEKIFFNIKMLKKYIFITNQGNINFEKDNNVIFNINSSTNNNIIKEKRRMSVIQRKNLVILAEKELKLCYIIMKLISNFHIFFNDRLVHNALTNKNKFPSFDSINKNSIFFSFIKTDLGRALIKLNIRVLYTLQIDHSNNMNDEKYQNAMNQGIKILQSFLCINDAYLLSLIQSLKMAYYYKKNNKINENNDLNYKKVLKEKNKLENSFKKFFIFESSLEEVIEEVSQSIDIVLGNSSGNLNNSNTEEKVVGLLGKRNIYIIKSNYYFTLSKFYQILYFSEMKKEKLPEYLKNNEKTKEKEESISKLIEKIFYFYKNFIYNSQDNSLLLMSNYIFNDLCKVPINYGLQNFDLFYESSKNIINNSTAIVNINNYIKNLFIYLEFLRGKLYPKIDECLLIYLNIIELFISNIKSLNPEEGINEIKGILIKINKEYKILEKYLESKNGDKEKERYEQGLILYIKMINDIFVFTNIKDKKKIQDNIKPEAIISALQNYNINLNLRTEFLRYIRKIYIDLTYDENNNSSQMYTNSLIIIEDQLLLLKTNPLISNLRYPTKLLSFFKNFLNLSAHSEIKEKTNKKFKTEEPSKVYTFKFGQRQTKIEEVESSLCQTIKEKQIDEEDDEKEDYINYKENNNGKESSLVYSNIFQSDNSEESEQKSFKPYFDNKIYELLMNELINIKKITSSIKSFLDHEMETLRNYFENGLLIPIIFFVKSSFAVSHCFSGLEMIKFYNLIIESCNLRLHIAEYKYDFWKELKNTNPNLEEKHNNMNLIDFLKIEESNFCKLYNNKSSIINGSFCINFSLNLPTINSLNLLKKKKFLCFDYTSLYNIFEQSIFSLMKDRQINKYKEVFMEENNDISLKMILKKEKKIVENIKSIKGIEKRIIRLYLLYKISKKTISNENNSSLFSILPELCIELETNYRHLLITFLINNGIKLDLPDDKERRCFHLLYKLLSLQTHESQNILINLIGGHDIAENILGFISKFSENLLKKIILLFIEFFNPPDNLLDNNYVCCFLLIKIFKYLCEEHNNYFQCRLMKFLNYKYVEEVPCFYEEESKEESQSERRPESIYISHDHPKYINFFDFFLHVILKIILISEWDKIDTNDQINRKQNKYLYDIFESILEMLNEIIQGNKPELLNRLGNSIVENEKKNIEKLIDEMESHPFYGSIASIKLPLNEKEESKKEIPKIDIFQYFVKNVTNFIFNDKASNELIYIIRNNLMDFFTTILEEKNCNEEVQKFIIKYININRVFISISSILKSYYLRKSSENDIIKNINFDFSSLQKSLYITKRQSNPQSNNIYDLYRFATTFMEKNKTRVSYDFSFRIPTMKKDFPKIKKKKIMFNEKLYEFYKNLYFSFKDFSQTNEFKLTNAFYKYIKLITVHNKSDEAKQMIEKTLSISEEAAKRKFYFRELNENKEKFNILNKTENKLVNKIASTNLNTHLLDRKKKVKNKSKFSDNNLKINESELMDININKIRNTTTEKKSFFSINMINQRNKKKPNFSSLIKENINEFNKDSIENYFIIKFFESITTTVEVRTDGAINQTVIFTQPPEVKYLSNGTKSEFEREVNRDSETSKKNDLIRNAVYFEKEIKYYQRKQSRISSWISKIDFLYVQIGSYIYALFFNLLILLTLNGDVKITFENKEIGTIKSRRTDINGINDSIDNSIYKWGIFYNLLCYIYVSLNGICIFLWIYFRMPLYYKIDRLKYMEENNILNKKHLKFYQKIYIILVMTIYKRDYITTLIYEFIFSLIGAFMKRGEMIYAFMLLPIIDLNNILKNIIISMKLQYDDVCLTFFFASIIIYVFSNLVYFFFNEDFSQEIEYRNDNVCKTLIFCFLNALDSGLRARGGIGDSAIRLSYNRNKIHYIKRIIIDDIFFILIVIIAIDLVFGIILGAFTMLRNKEQKHMADKKNHCFICHVNKNTLEKNRQNFNEHRTKTHNPWNYVYYMITLKFSDPHDLNSINSYAYKKIENKDISWLPTFKDLTDKGKNGKNDDFDQDLKVEEENISKYFVKLY